MPSFRARFGAWQAPRPRPTDRPGSEIFGLDRRDPARAFGSSSTRSICASGAPVPHPLRALSPARAHSPTLACPSPSWSAELSDLTPRRSDGLEPGMRDREASHEPFLDSRTRAPIAGAPSGVSAASGATWLESRSQGSTTGRPLRSAILRASNGLLLLLDDLPPRPARWAARRRLRRHLAWPWRRRRVLARSSMRVCVYVSEGASACAVAPRGRR